MKKICGAKRQNKDEKCQRSAMANGKCYYHGGKTPKGIASANFKTGKHSKYSYLPGDFSSRPEKLISDHIENIEESLQIQKALETTYLEKLGTNESTEAWKKLSQAVKEYDDAAHSAKPEEKALRQAQAFGMIRWIVEEGLNQSFLYRDIQGIQESQRKLSETLSKVRKETQEIYTQEQWNEMLGVLVQILRNEIQDREILQRIQDELYRRSQQEAKQLGNGK